MTVNRATRKSRSILSVRNHRALAALSAATGLVAFAAASRADTFGENGSTTSLNTAGAWTNETVPPVNSPPPGSADIAQFDALDTLTGSQTYTLGGGTSWLGLSIVNPAGSVVIGNAGDSTNTLTLGASGVNMSGATQDLTLVDPILIGTNQSFNVGSGRTLTDSGPLNLNTSATLTFNGAGNQNITGTINDAGGGGAIVQSGTGTIVLTNSNSFTGSTTINQGVIELNFAAAGAPASNILPSAAQLRLNGGTLLVNGGASGGTQTFSSSATNGPTVIGPGLSTVKLVSNGTAPTVNLGTIAANQTTANLGGQMVFVGPATSSDGLNASPVAATGTITVGSQPTSTGGILMDTNTLGPLGVVAQSNGQVTDWAAAAGGVVVGGSTISGFYTSIATGTGVSLSGNADIATAGEVRISSSGTATTMRFNTPDGGLFNGNGNNLDQFITKSGKTLQTGGILVTPNVGANNIVIGDDAGGAFLTNATLQPNRNATNNDQLNIYQYDTQNALIINTGIRNGGNPGGGYAQAGPGVVQLNGVAIATQFTASTNLNGGLTVLGSFAQGSALGNSSGVNLNGGALATYWSGNIDNGTPRPIAVLGNGGAIATSTGNTLTIDGQITGTGALNIGMGTFATNDASNATNTVTTSSAVGNGTIVVTGATNSFSGQTNVNAGVLRVDTGSNLGTSSIAVNSGGTLVGTANLTSAVAINSGGQLTPGDPIPNGPVVGTMGVSSLLLNTGSILNYAFTGTSSLIDVTSALKINSGAGLNAYQNGTSSVFTNSGTYHVFDLSAGATLTGLSNLSVLNGPGSPVTYTFGTAPDGSGGTFVTLVVVGTTPENWNIAGGGSWLTAGDWNPALAGGPNGVGQQAVFPVNIPSTSTPETGGTVTLDGSKTLGSLMFQSPTASWMISPGTGGTLTMQNAGTTPAQITNSAGNNTIAVPVNLASNTSVASSIAGTTLTISGSISGAGGLTVNSGAAGTVLLTANNNYGGVTALQGGTLQVGTGGANGSLGTNTTPIANTGTLIMDVTTTQSLTVQGPSGAFVQSGNGTTILNGNNTASTVTLNAGTIQVGTGGSLTANAGNLTMNSGTLLDLNGANASFGGLTGAGGTIDNVNTTVAANTMTIGGDNNSNTFSGTIKNTTGTLALVKMGNGTQTLGSANSYSGGTTISGGIIRVNASGGLGSGVVNDNTGNGIQLANGVTLSNAIVAGSSLEFEDVPDNNASATISGAVTVVGSDQLRFGTSNNTSTLILTGSATSGAAGSITIITRGNVVIAGSGSVVSNDTTSALVIGRQSNTSTLNLTMQDNSTMTSVDGVVLAGINGTSDNAAVSLTMVGNASISAGGSFNFNDADSNGTAEINAVVNVNFGGNSNVSTTNFLMSNLPDSNNTTVNFTGGTITATAADPTGSQFFPWFNNPNLPLPGLFTANISAGGATINNGGFAITIAQQLTDGGGGAADTLKLAGTGTTVLANSNTYTGNTTLTAGTLTVANNSGSATGSGNVILNGGTLASASAALVTTLQNDATASDPAAGSGFISGNVIAGSAPHTIAPGDVGSVGTLNVGGLTTNANTTLNFDLGTGTGVVTNGDQLVIGSGTISIGSLTVISVGGSATVGADYRIIGAPVSGGLVGGINDANFVLPNPSGGVGFTLSNNGVDPGWIDLVAVASGPASLIWKNSTGNNLWNVNTSANWNNGTNPAIYSNNTNITFNDSNGGAGNYNVTLNTSVSPLSVTVNNSAGDYTISGSGAITGGSPLNKAGSRKLVINTANTSLGAVTITAGSVQLGASTGLATLTSLTISGAGTFDVNNNHVIINYGAGPDPAASIGALLATGYAGGAWNGAGGITSTAAAATSTSYGLGWADSADTGNPAGLASGTIEIKYTLLGDADLNGIVNGIDFGIVAANFNKGVTSWDQGDFDYSHIVNGIDFGDLAANFNKGANGASAGVSAADWAALEAFAAANGLTVPEPASLGLLTLGAVGILSRRRRRMSN